MSPESVTSASAVTPLTEPLVYSVHTGVPVADGGDADAPTAARLGLEPPRYCGQCGRRMVVQVVPTGLDGAMFATRVGRLVGPHPSMSTPEAAAIPDRVVVRRDPRALVRPTVVVLGVLLALGAVGGVVWGLVVPGVTGVVVAPGRAGALGADTGHRFDAIALFACISMVVGVLAGVVVWSVRALRGPVGAVLVAIGTLAGGALGAWFGGLVAHGRHPGPGGAAVGEYFTSAPGLRLAGARLDLTGGLDVSVGVGMSWAVLVVAPAVGLVVVLVRILAARSPDLDVPADAGASQPDSGRRAQGGELVGDA